MKRFQVLKALAIAGVLAASVVVLSACGGDPNSGVAATVNGTEIPEKDVTQEVAHVRAQSGLSDNEQWGKYLVQNDMTAESVRETIIDNLVEDHLIVEAATELEIEVSDEEVDETINKFKENYSSDTSWQNALEQAGFTEDSYRESVKSSMVQKKVGEHFEGQVEPTDEDYVSSAKTYASYYNGAKRTSHVLVSVSNQNDTEEMATAKATADDIIVRLNNGSLSFEDAVSEYSGDEGSKENGGDVGWDKLNSFVTEYTDAIKDLHAGDITPEPALSQYGYHVIKVTEEFNAPEADQITSMDQIPEAFQENIKRMAVSVKANTLYTDWLDEVKESAEIEINPMPKGLPYDIDLKKYQEEKEAQDAASEADSADTTTDGADVPADTTSDGTDMPVDNAVADEYLGDAADNGAALDATTNPDGTTTIDATADVTAEGETAEPQSGAAQ